MADEKNPKEASNIFHSIMKASVTPAHADMARCPECGLMADFIPPSIKDGQNLVANYKCPNNHEFLLNVPLP
jgi:hypothetical protein